MESIDYKSNFHGSVYQYNCSEKENLSQETAIDLEYFNIRKLRLDVAKTFKSLRFNQSVINSANKIKNVIGPGPWAGVAIRSWSDYRRRQDLFDLKSVENQLNRLHPKYSIFLTSDMPCIEDYFVSRLRRPVIISSQVPVFMPKFLGVKVILIIWLFKSYLF